MVMSQESMKVVYTVVERSPGKSFWTRVGIGFVNRDGSLNLRLDAIPTNGTLQVRDWEERDAMQRPGASPTSMPRSSSPPDASNASASRTRDGRGNDATGGLA
jgi:hypothetical protein